MTLENNIKPVSEERNNTESLSDTVSMHSGSDSLYTKLSDSEQLCIKEEERDTPEIKQEKLEEEEAMLIDTSHEIRMEEDMENHLPVTRIKNNNNQREISNSEEEISERMDTDTSEDISKIPDLPEDDDQGKPDDSCEKTKITLIKQKKTVTLPKEIKEV